MTTEVFGATYKVSVQGPMLPLIVTDSTGAVVTDSGSQTIVLKNKATLKFDVQPFLPIHWIGTLVLNPDYDGYRAGGRHAGDK